MNWNVNMFKTGWLLLTSSAACHYAQQKSANFKFVWPRTFRRTTFGPATFAQRSSWSQTLKVASPWNLTLVPKSMPSKVRWGEAPCPDISHDHLAGPGIANTRFAFGISRSTWGGCVTWGGYEIVNGRGLSSVWRWPHFVHWTLTVTGRDSSQASGRFNLKSKYKKTGTIGQRYILMVNEGRVQRRTENRWVWSYPTPPPSQIWFFPGSKSNPHFSFRNLIN